MKKLLLSFEVSQLTVEFEMHLWKTNLFLAQVDSAFVVLYTSSDTSPYILNI